MEDNCLNVVENDAKLELIYIVVEYPKDYMKITKLESESYFKDLTDVKITYESLKHGTARVKIYSELYPDKIQYFTITTRSPVDNIPCDICI